MDTGNNAWILTSTALVLLMTPGLALFYGGMVRAKNILNMLMLNFWCMGVVPVVWVRLGFSFAFAPSFSDAGLLGNFDNIGFKDVGPSTEIVLFAAFQLTFAIITVALISGAITDRLRFVAWAVFVPIWSLLVYSPVAHWVFNGTGWLAERGALDFAGGTVVHINAGAAALAFVLVLGRRRGWPGEGMSPHSLVLTMIGAGILWFGWFGFNAGSALAADGLAIQAFMNTFLAAATAMVVWLIVERLRDGHATSLGAASGVVAGLVAITPAAGFVGGMAPLAIGAAASICCYFAIQLKYRFRYDDSLDVVGVHLVGGLVGSVLIGLFADLAVNEGGADGLFFGGGLGLLGEQLIASLSVLAFSFVATMIIVKVLDLVMGGVRVSEEVEQTGLDETQHSESGYSFGELGSMGRVG